ncbi:electron transport complex subunit RsxD [Alginatibacterium sediminis]|uniref:Ion-translocating oxidoreductase complex subunit D n=1 Tax=Alginatibacterium sediminis TaxID=2164068 RepID=A0A420EGY2_9ALTE|nr:electron transport complex subunit RsxD [Alginatibacterium sediminis]RKF19928.1 electron transport complex subunit RsxD [Alginatibacterium sediminis]
MISSSPYMRVQRKTSELMLIVCCALVPGIIAQIWQFGYGVIIQLALAIVCAYFCEALIQILRRRNPFIYLKDNSALLTAMLLAVSIPPYSPWWLTIIGVSFSIIIVKQLYGGLGHNLFNPAMAGYVLLLISFPVLMTSWSPAAELLPNQLSITQAFDIIIYGFTQDGFSLRQVLSIDGFTLATPLDAFKTGLDQSLTSSEIIQQAMFDSWGPKGWNIVNLAFLLGGLGLILSKAIRWHIPVSFLLSLSTLTLLSQIIAPDQSVSLSIQLLSGATMLGAFFILTDPVSAATSNKGRLVYGALIGLLVFVIRTWGGYPDGVAFAVLLANICVPMIDYYIRDRVYGYQK